MRILQKGKHCKPNEAVVSYRLTVTGERISACVSTEKKPFVVENITYYQGRHCIVQPYRENISEYNIFKEHDEKWTGRDSHERRSGSFIMCPQYIDPDQPDYEYPLVVGMGTGALLGGLDKELRFKPVSKKVYDHVKSAQMLFKHYDDLEHKHNFLFGDSNAKEMERARHMRCEMNQKLGELTGFYC
jgi:hypothetical protein